MQLPGKRFAYKQRQLSLDAISALSIAASKVNPAVASAKSAWIGWVVSNKLVNKLFNFSAHVNPRSVLRIYIEQSNRHQQAHVKNRSLQQVFPGIAGSIQTA